MTDFSAYEIEPSEDDSETYTFQSDGRANILKAIRYTPINTEVETDYIIYNLGFGDFNPEASSLSDDTISNNGDQYKVFGTVLSTIPQFFESHPKDRIFVQGSDSAADFPDKCRASCKKRCGETCKNLGRRINLYCRFISKFLDVFSAEYQIYGVLFSENETVIIPFEKGTIYHGVLIYKLK